MAAEISAFLNFLVPIGVFVLVFVIIYAILRTSKLLGGVAAIDVIVGIIIAVIFASISSARDYIKTVAPWFVILVVAVFFVIFILSFVAGKFSGPKWVGIVFLILLALVFIFAAFKVFNINPFVNGGDGQAEDSAFLSLIYWILQENVLGAILLIIIAAIVVWVVIKK